MKNLPPIALLLFGLCGQAAFAGQEEKQEKEQTGVPDEETRFKQFEELLSGSKLVGQYTIIGKQGGPSRQEEYTIKKVTKADQGDYWLFNTRIKYGDQDATVPLPLEVKWAGDTPVITLTNVTIPGLGTFTSRVVIYNGKYAGTWTHGNVGGHLFGTIEKVEAEESGERH